MAAPIKFALYLPFIAILAAQSAPEALISHAGERTLRCALEPILPAMLYTAPEIAAGYTYSIPLKQYNGTPPEHGWSVIAGFTPDSGQGKETYLTSHIDASALNRETISGLSTYWMGLGSYSIRVAISDDRGGVCRKDWTAAVGQSPKSGRGAMFDSTMGDVFIPVGAPAFDFRTEAILSHSKIILGTPGNTVRVPARGDNPPAGQSRAHGITILLHVPYDPVSQVALLDVLEALLARIPAESVRLVAFNLRDGREIFRQDGFQWSAMDRLKETFGSLQFRAVAVAELQTRMTEVRLLDSLAQSELRETRRSDAVIFLGMNRGPETTGVRFSTEPRPSMALFSYIRLLTATIPANWPAAMRSRSAIEFHDLLIPHLVGKLKGNTLDVALDKQFDQAIEKIRRPLRLQ